MITSIIKSNLFKKIVIGVLSVFSLYLLALILSSAFNNLIILPSPNEVIKSLFSLLGSKTTYI